MDSANPLSDLFNLMAQPLNALAVEMTMNLICFKHPEYAGSSAPVLSCKVCCGLFIAVIKEKNSIGTPLDTSKWLEEKSRENQEGARRVINARYGFDPRSV